MFSKEKITKFINSELYFFVFLALNFASWFFSGKFDDFLMNKTFNIGVVFSILIIIIHFCILLIICLKEKETYFLIPAIFGVLFANNTHITTKNIPYFQIILGILTVIIVILFFIKNKVKFSLGKLGLGLLLLFVCGVISLINAPKGLDWILYYMGFAWAPFVIIYLVLINSNKSNLINYLSKCMIFLGLLVSFQIIYLGLRDNNLSSGIPVHFLGWGISNDASIIICCCLPFLFYEILKKSHKILYLLIAFIIFALAQFYTMSRGGFFLFAASTVICTILTYIYTENKKKFSIYAGVLALFFIVVLIIQFDNIIEIIKITLQDGLNLTGRDKLYITAWEKFKEHPFIGTSSLTCLDGSNRFVIYHSTFFNTLATTGLLGISALVFHYFQKYKMLFGKLNVFIKLSLVYFILTDLYGLFDNTYTALQYTSIMVIVLAIIEVSNNHTSLCCEN